LVWNVSVTGTAGLGLVVTLIDVGATVQIVVFVGGDSAPHASVIVPINPGSGVIVIVNTAVSPGTNVTTAPFPPFGPGGTVNVNAGGGPGGFTMSTLDSIVPVGSVAVMVTFVLAATVVVVILKVPLIAAPAMLKLPRTVATVVLLLIKITIKPARGAGPFRATVPTEPLPPTTGLGLNVMDVMTAGLTVKLPLAMLVPRLAITVTIVCVATPTVVAVNVCDVDPAAIVTAAGTMTEGSPLLKETVNPPAGAAEPMVTVPVEVVPPVTAAGTKLRPVKATTVTFAMSEVVPVVAVTVTVVEAATAPAVTWKVWLFVFTRTVTFAGTGSTPALLLVRLTVIPPAGAFPLSVTVPVVICPGTTVAGLNDSIVTTGGITVRPPDKNVPLGSVAVMLTAVLAATGSVVTLKVPLVAPPATLKLAGTVAALGLLLIKVTVRPVGGAGPLKTSVPTEPTPPLTEPGLNVSDVIPAGLTVSVPVTLLAPSVAVTVTMVCVATPTVVAVNVCDVFPARIITVPGTVTEGSPLLNETVIPPAGATWLIVTVPVELVPPVTAAGLKLRLVTAVGGSTVTFPVTMVVPVVAVTVTGVAVATAPPVTMNV